MRLDEFRDLAARYGGEIGRWPERHRPEARALAATSPAAAATLADAQALDRLIVSVRPQVLPERVDRAMGAVVRRIAVPAQPSWWQRIVPILAPATSFACAAALGVVLGLAQPVSPAGHGGAEALVAIVLDGGALPSGWFY